MCAKLKNLELEYVVYIKVLAFLFLCKFLKIFNVNSMIFFKNPKKIKKIKFNRFLYMVQVGSHVYIYGCLHFSFHIQLIANFG
jgi:hypothetical protein